MMASPASPDELQTLLHHAGFAAPTGRALLRVTGSDATRWLNGMVTNHIAALAPGEGNYNFLLNAQGRIQGDCLVFREPGATQPASFLLATEGAQAEALQAHLDRFIIMDDVELTPAYPDETSLELCGPDGPAALRALDLPVLDPACLVQADTPHGPVLLFAPPVAAAVRFELRGGAATMGTLRAHLLSGGVVEVTERAVEQLRILEGRPRFGTDIRDRELPQETAQTHALHFAKGCYLGQEIVERIHSRGQVHRTFAGFRLEGVLPAFPVPLESGGKPVGELTSGIEVGLADGSALLALGYCRREVLQSRETPGSPTPLTYPGGVAHSRSLPRVP